MPVNEEAVSAVAAPQVRPVWSTRLKAQILAGNVGRCTNTYYNTFLMRLTKCVVCFSDPYQHQMKTLGVCQRSVGTQVWKQRIPRFIHVECGCSR